MQPWTQDQTNNCVALFLLRKPPREIANIVRRSHEEVLELLENRGYVRRQVPLEPPEKKPRVEYVDEEPVETVITVAANPDEPYDGPMPLGFVTREIHPVELLTESNCHYPIGDVGEPGFHFCCKPTALGSDGLHRTYCPDHAWIGGGRR